MATLKQLIEYSKANPNSDIAAKTQKAITGGAYDQRAAQEGVDLSWAGRPTLPKPEPSFMEKASKVIRGEEPLLTSSMKEATKSAAENILGIKERVKQAPTLPEKVIAGGEGAFRAVGDIAGGILSPLTDLITKSRELTGADKDTNAIMQKLGEWQQNNPEAAKDLNAALNIFGLTGGIKIAPKVAETTLPKLGTTIKAGAEATAEKLATTKKAIGGKIETITKGKTLDQVLTTPEEQVYKLNPTERKTWFESQKTKITEKQNLAEKQIKEEMTKKTTAIEQEAENLQKELATASRDKVLELRPKIRSAMGEQSATYRKLVEEELATKADISVQTNELKSFIESKYAQNPEFAKVIVNKLGLPEENIIGSIKQIYEKTMSLKQEIKAGAKKGTSVFTPEEKMIDDTISILNDYLSSKGVDLSAARSFWAKYAPIRDQLVKEAKPFVQSSTQTKTFAETLKRVAKGTDVNNENFINEVENLLGESITKENASILKKIGENEKTAIANKIATEQNIMETKLLENKALQKLSAKAFEAERQAQIRTIIKNAIKYVIGGGVGLEILRRTTGL